MTQGKLLLLLAAHLVMTGMPGAAGALLAARKGVKQVPVLLAIALAASGVLAMLTFWLYLAAPPIGKAFSYLSLAVAAATVASLLRNGRTDPALRRQLATPLVLWILGSSFLVFLGFVHGGTGSPVAMSATRFSGQLPSDNDIPQFFAHWFYTHGHSGRPPVYPAGWLASDRPPLLIGYVLTEQAIGWDSHGLNYQLIGVITQQLWIVALWALLVAARVGRVTRALTLITVLVSDLAIVNGFYVWPKMLPAAMLLAAAALLITPAWPELRRRPWAAVLIATLLALAMLGHGSSIFGVIPLVLIAGFRGLPDFRWLAVAVAVGAALYVPWSAYQSYGDPPGNRVVKWMVAGAGTPDDRSTSSEIVDAYRAAGLGGTLHNKAENFVTIAGGGPMVADLKSAVDAAESGHLGMAVGQIRTIFFFYLLPSFGLLLIAPLLMVLARLRRVISGPEWRFALVCYLVVTVGVIIWALLLFGNGTSRAVIHTGTYVLPVLGFCAAVAGVRAAFPRFAIYLLAINALASLALYIPALSPPSGTSYSPLALAIAIASLAAFGVVALRGASMRGRWRAAQSRLAP